MHEEATTLAAFLSGWELFRDPILCGVLAGALLGYLGVFVVLRRMVFVTAAISQSAGLGVALAFFAEIHLGFAAHPVLGAAVLSLATAILLANHSERLRVSRESMLGMSYIAAGALAVIVGDRISQEAHDISSILFGTAVLVRPLDLLLIAIAGAVLAVVQIACYRGILFASFDPAAARVQQVPVRLLDSLLWISVAIEVSVATRALGVLPVFAFAVLPAMTALAFARRMGVALFAASLLGAVAGGAGYVVAFFGSFPVGAAQALVSVALFFLVLPAAWITRERR